MNHPHIRDIATIIEYPGDTSANHCTKIGSLAIIFIVLPLKLVPPVSTFAEQHLFLPCFFLWYRLTKIFLPTTICLQHATQSSAFGWLTKNSIDIDPVMNSVPKKSSSSQFVSNSAVKCCLFDSTNCRFTASQSVTGEKSNFSVSSPVLSLFTSIT